MQRESEKEKIRQEILAAESVLQRRVLEEEVRRELMMERQMAVHRAGKMGLSIDERLPSPRDFYIIQREIEKERIKQEIHAAESVRRQVLEEEVRRELMLEREMAMHRASKMGLSIDERHEALPPTQFSCAVRDGNKSALEVNRKDRSIILPRPEANLHETKQKASKASTPPKGSGDPTMMSLKTLKEWSCALCQVSASSATGLHDHLLGKKHKAKEAELRAQKVCKNSSALHQEKTGKQIELTECGDTTGSEMESPKVDEKSLQEKTVNYLNQKKEDSKNKTASSLPRGSGEPNVMSSKTQKWSCALCKISANSKTGLQDHLLGKKHKAKVAELMVHKARKKPFALQQEETGKQIKLTERGDTTGSEMVSPKVDEESLQEKTVDYSNQKKEDSKKKNEELPKLKGLIAENQKNENVMPAEKTGKKKLARRKKLKFKVDVKSLQAEKTLVKNKELPKQKDLNVKNQKNENGRLTAKKGKTKVALVRKLKFKADEESRQAEKTGDYLNQKNQNSKNNNKLPTVKSGKTEQVRMKKSLQAEKIMYYSKNKNVVPPKQKDLSAENQKNKNVMPKQKVLNAENQRNKNVMPIAKGRKTKRVGAQSVVVMKAHKKGKKHTTCGKELNQNGEAASSTTKTTTVASSGVFKMPKI